MPKTFAFIVAAVVLMLGLPAQAADIEWKPVAQPDLAAKLEAAPELKFQDLADGPDSCWQGPLWWVPNPDGKTYDLVFIYYPSYPGPHQIFIYDTATKELKKSQCPELSKVLFSFHLNHFYLIKGKAYIASGYGPVCLFTYDPATNALEFGGYPLGQEGAGVVRGAGGLIVPNDEGTLLCGFGPMVSNKNQIGFYTIDPVTLKGNYLGTIGPDNPNFAWEYRRIVTDGDWIYASVGTTPWRLYGMNIKTRQGKVIAETERFIGDRNTIHFLSNPNYPGVYVSITGLKGEPQDKTRAFWLRNGELTACEPVGRNTIPVPPWTDEKLAKPRKYFRGTMDETDLPPKGMEVARGPVDLEGKVRVWYRLTDTKMAEAAKVEAGQWQRIDLSVQLTPQAIRRMAPLPDGSLFAVTEGYGRAVTFDPKTGQRRTLGPTMSVYSLCPFEGKLYISGYSGSQVWIYDPTKPWTVGQSPEAPPEKAAGREAIATRQSNPANMGMLKEFTDVHMPWAFAVGGDGRIYFGGKVVRIGNGGGLGWWDAREHKAGGFSKPFDNYTVFWMCSADNGRYILCSTKPVAGRTNPDYTPPRGRLFVYDTTKHELTQQIDDERLEKFPGYIIEALPGLVMGYAPAKGGQEGLLYGFDPAIGKVLWTKPIPRVPETSFSATKKGKYCFTKGPDGFIWAAMDGVLVRINPQTAEVVPVGKMEDNPIVFLDGDIYVAGSVKFRKIDGIPKLTPAR